MQNVSHLSGRVVSLLVIAALAACARPSVEVGDVEAAPLERLPLLLVDETPGCTVARPQELPNDPAADSLEAATIGQLRNLEDMELSFDAQLALLMVQPILKDPAALSWSEVQESARYEAEVLSEGDTWVTIRAVRSFGLPGGDTGEHVVDIDVTAGRTVYVLNGRTFEVTANTLVYDGGARGCDPDTGTSFAMLPSKIVDGVVQSAPVCWPGEELSLLACLQIIDRALN